MGDVIRFPDGYIAAREYGWVVVIKNRRRRIQLDKRTILRFAESTMQKMGLISRDERLIIVKRNRRERKSRSRLPEDGENKRATRLYGIRRR